DGEVGVQLGDEREKPVGVARLAHDLEAEPLEQAREALPQEHLVLGHDDAEAHPLTGSSTSIDVPSSATVVRTNVPPRASPRSTSPVRPEPWASAPPPRSSRTAPRSTPSSSRASTHAAVAPACFAVLVSASETT